MARLFITSWRGWPAPETLEMRTKGGHEYFTTFNPNSRHYRNSRCPDSEWFIHSSWMSSRWNIRTSKHGSNEIVLLGHTNPAQSEERLTSYSWTKMDVRDLERTSVISARDKDLVADGSMSNAVRHNGEYYSFIQMYLCSIFALTSCAGEWCLIFIKPRERE